MVLLAVLNSTATAQTIKSTDVPQKVYDYVEFPPHFPGGVKIGMERVLSTKFHYPEEAWKSAKVKQTELSFIVRRDGAVVNVVTDESLHPSLAAELQRVLPQMPLWFPAYLNGQKMDARVGVTVDLVDRRTGLPYHLQTAIKSLERYTSHPHAPQPMGEEQLRTALNDLGALGDTYAEYRPTTVTMVRMLASLGEKERAVALIDRGTREYELLDPYRQVDGAPAIVSYRPGYTGKDDVLMHLQRAVAFDYCGRPSTARRAYDKVLQLAQTKLKTGDIGMPDFDRDDEGDRFLKREEIMEKMYYRLMNIDARQLSEEDMLRLTTVQRTPQNIIPIIEELTAAGTLHDVKLTQQKEEVKRLMNEEAHGRLKREDAADVYKLEVLAVLLRDGQPEAVAFIDRQLNEGTLRPGGKSALTKLRKQLATHAADLSDRDMLVRVVATYGPTKGDVTADDYYKAAHLLTSLFPLM